MNDEMVAAGRGGLLSDGVVLYLVGVEPGFPGIIRAAIDPQKTL